MTTWRVRLEIGDLPDDQLRALSTGLSMALGNIPDLQINEDPLRGCDRLYRIESNGELTLIGSFVISPETNHEHSTINQE